MNNEEIQNEGLILLNSCDVKSGAKSLSLNKLSYQIQSNALVIPRATIYLSKMQRQQFADRNANMFPVVIYTVVYWIIRFQTQHEGVSTLNFESAEQIAELLDKLALESTV